MPRILKGISSRLLPCGCLAGVYETYDGEIVTIIDARGSSCAVSTHVDGNVVPNEPPIGDGTKSRRTSRPASRE
jgi:hypothetical protein